MTLNSTSAKSLYGTLNLLILRTLAREEQHGLGLLRSIEAAADTGLTIEEGALYPALHRLERDGLVVSRWGLSESNRKAKFYRLTRKGRQRCEAEVESWLLHTGAVARVLGFDLSLPAAG